MQRIFLSMMLAVVAMCGWAADDNKTLKVKLDLVDFGDSVVVYRSGHEEQTFIGKDGKFEFKLEVDTVDMGILLQPKALRGDMDDLRVYNIPLVGGETVLVVDRIRPATMWKARGSMLTITRWIFSMRTMERNCTRQPSNTVR